MARLLRVKRLAHRWLPWAAWELAGRVSLPLVLDRVASRSRPGFFVVQIGSNDGREGDPLYELVIRRRWHGLFVEPVPEIFARLERSYAGVTGISLANVAIGEEEGVRSLYWVSRERNDPTWVDQIGSFDLATVLRHEARIDRLRERVEEIQVPVITFPVLLDRFRVERIDFLHIDTEGFDLQVLRQVEFGSTRAPKYVLYEHKHLDVQDREAAERLLRAAGYQVVAFDVDTFARRGRGRWS